MALHLMLWHSIDGQLGRRRRQKKSGGHPPHFIIPSFHGLLRMHHLFGLDQHIKLFTGEQAQLDGGLTQ